MEKLVEKSNIADKELLMIGNIMKDNKIPNDLIDTVLKTFSMFMCLNKSYLYNKTYIQDYINDYKEFIDLYNRKENQKEKLIESFNKFFDVNNNISSIKIVIDDTWIVEKQDSEKKVRDSFNSINYEKINKKDSYFVVSINNTEEYYYFYQSISNIITNIEDLISKQKKCMQKKNEEIKKIEKQQYISNFKEVKILKELFKGGSK